MLKGLTLSCKGKGQGEEIWFMLLYKTVLVVGAVDLTHLLAWDLIKRALPWCWTGSRHDTHAEVSTCYAIGLWYSVQEYSRTDKWKKAVREQTCPLQLQMLIFFQLHNLTWIPHYPVLWKRVESFHSNPVWYSQLYEDENFQKENSQNRERKEAVVYSVHAGIF